MVANTFCQGHPTDEMFIGLERNLSMFSLLVSNKAKDRSSTIERERWYSVCMLTDHFDWRLVCWFWRSCEVIWEAAQELWAVGRERERDEQQIPSISHTQLQSQCETSVEKQ